jgi:hypothetical protein
VKVPIGFWRPEPGESAEEFDQRVSTEMTAAIALVKGAGESEDPEAAPDAAPEPGGEA